MQLFSNFAQTTLASTLLVAGTSMTVQSTDGGLFQAPVAPNYELLTLTDGTNWEVVKVTGRVGDVFTVERAFEGVAREWPSDTIVRAVATEETLNNFVQRHEISGLARIVAFTHFF